MGVVDMKKSLLALALIVALPTSALAENWMMRVRAIDIVPDVDAPSLPGLDVSDAWVPELDFTYFVTPNIGMELILATTRRDVTLNGASLGGALQAGVDIAVTKNGYINLDVKKIWIDTTVKTAAGATVTDLDLNPVVWGIGYGFR